MRNGKAKVEEQAMQDAARIANPRAKAGARSLGEIRSSVSTKSIVGTGVDTAASSATMSTFSGARPETRKICGDAGLEHLNLIVWKKCHT